MTEEETDKLWKEKGIELFSGILPEVIEWYYLCWDYIYQDWKSGTMKSNSYKAVKRYVKRKHTCSQLYIYPNTKRGREASFSCAWD